MKYTLLISLGMAVFFSMETSAQLTDSLNKLQEQPFNDRYFSNQNKFENDHQIDLEEERMAKILDNTYLLTQPLEQPSNTMVPLPKGEIVIAYKYLPQSNCWAVKYKDYFGYVPTSYIMPVQEKSEPTNYTPYDEAPAALNRLRVKYPDDALDQGIQGVVSLKVLITRKGQVKEVEVVQGIPELNDAAIEAVENLKFRPGKYKGNPVDVWLRIPVTFSIED